MQACASEVWALQGLLTSFLQMQIQFQLGNLYENIPNGNVYFTLLRLHVFICQFLASAGLAHINIDRMVIRVAHPRRSVTAGAGVQPELLECAVLLTVT